MSAKNICFVVFGFIGLCLIIGGLIIIPNVRISHELDKQMKIGESLLKKAPQEVQTNAFGQETSRSGTKLLKFGKNGHLGQGIYDRTGRRIATYGDDSAIEMSRR